MKRKKLKPVEFSFSERRIHGLPISGEIVGKDAEALRKILDAFPWMTTVAEYRFDQKIANAFVHSEAMKIQAARTVIDACKQYEKERRAKP